MGASALQQIVFDTSAVRSADRFDWWATQMDEQIGMTTEPVEIGPFEGRASVLTLPPLTHLTFEVGNTLAVRRPRQIRRLEWGAYFIYREMGEGGRFEIGERRFVTNRGDLLIYDGDREFRGQAKVRYNHHLWIVPKSVLDPHLPVLPRPLAVHIPARSGIADLAVAYVDALAGTLAKMTEAEAAAVADHLGRLIAMACGGQAVGGHLDALRQAKLAQARRLVERHLASPELGPELVAAAIGISVRQLHMLFQPTGESFGRFVRRRRLQECKAALESPLGALRSVTDIAFGWGFASLPTFYRAFSTEFDAAPGDIRRAVRRG